MARRNGRNGRYTPPARSRQVQPAAATTQGLSLGAGEHGVVALDVGGIPSFRPWFWCDQCGLRFGSGGIAMGPHSSVTITNNVENCPRCGHFPCRHRDGTYTFAVSLVEYVAADPKKRIAELERAKAKLEQAQSEDMTGAELGTLVQSWAMTFPWLPGNWSDLGVVLATISAVILAFQDHGVALASSVPPDVLQQVLSYVLARIPGGQASGGGHDPTSRE